MLLVYSSLCFVLYITASFLAYYIFNPKYRIIKVTDKESNITFRCQKLCWYFPYLYRTLNRDGKWELVLRQLRHDYGWSYYRTAEDMIKEDANKRLRMRSGVEVCTFSNDGTVFIDPNKEKEN